MKITKLEAYILRSPEDSRPHWVSHFTVPKANELLVRLETDSGIDGIGLLTFKAIGSRDYGIIMGFLVIGIFIRLFGNLISDLCYAAIDPRIRFK